MEVTYQRNLRKSYMRVRSRETAREAYEMQILGNYRIPWLLPMQAVMADGEWNYLYEISGKQQMEDHLAGKKLEGEMLKKLLFSLQGLCQALPDYLLLEERVCLEPEFIYIDLKDGKLCFTYLPFYEKSLAESFGRYMEGALRNLDHTDRAATELGYQVYQMCAEGNMGIQEILETALGRRDGSGAQDGSGAAWERDAEPGGWEKAREEKEEREEGGRSWKSLGGARPEMEIGKEKTEGKAGAQEAASGEKKAMLRGIADKLRKAGMEKGGLPGASEERRGAGARDAASGTEKAMLRGIADKLRRAGMEKGGLPGASEERRGAGARDIASGEKKAGSWKTAGKRKQARTWGAKAGMENSGPQAEEPEGFQGKGNASQGRPTEILCVQETGPIGKLEYQGVHGCQDILVAGESFLLGKNKGQADGIIDAEGVSRLHARISKEEGVYYIEDLNSTNGTYLNEIPLEYRQKKELARNDRIRFGAEEYVFF